jgi:DNA-binding CsgD family transcriptional regulator
MTLPFCPCNDMLGYTFIFFLAAPARPTKPKPRRSMVEGSGTALKDITPIMLMQEALQEKEKELLREREKLEETNTALRVLLRQRDEDRARLEETVYKNVDRLVLPYIEKLLQGRLSDQHRTLVEIADNNLREIVSPFLRTLSSLGLLLTPQEIEVANLVRNGRSSKEIADIMNLSVSGVDFHRKRLRQKLGLANTQKNLRSFLLTLQK